MDLIKTQANSGKPSEDQTRPHQSTMDTEEPPTKKQKVAKPVHSFLSKDGRPPFVRIGTVDIKTVPEAVDTYRREKLMFAVNFKK